MGVLRYGAVLTRKRITPLFIPLALALAKLRNFGVETTGNKFLELTLTTHKET
jgi:hypothetical protein